jgi:hypothetical protein
MGTQNHLKQIQKTFNISKMFFFKRRISIGTQNHLKQSGLGKSLEPIICTFKLNRVHVQNTRFYLCFFL